MEKEIYALAFDIGTTGVGCLTEYITKEQIGEYMNKYQHLIK